MTTSSNNIIQPISLPCLKGAVGKWYYYITILSFAEVANRVKLPKEIDEKYDDESLRLGDWIQRELEPKRTRAIVDYLHTQDQRFFNSLILGIYNGKPSWQDLNISSNKLYETIDSQSLEYFSRTFGILTLQGDEDIFAIDGQHRAIGIREAVKKYKDLGKEEVSIIFVAHHTDNEGKIRTRRLFSTLNRYAKPVSHSDIIALSEDNNCAIVTRNLIESELLQDKVLVNKARPMSLENTSSFTNILTLYDIVKRIITDEKVLNYQVSGKSRDAYITNREQDVEISTDTMLVSKTIQNIINNIPSLKTFFDGELVDRKLSKTNLVFRPIGQNIIFDVFKVALEYSKDSVFLSYLNKDTFNLENPIWRKIFWDDETNNIATDKLRQKAAILLMLEALSIQVKRTRKDIDIYNNLGIRAEQLDI